jgi:ankyrin repeat protein
MAAGSGDPATLEALLGAGAHADVVEEAWGQTALMFAAAAGHVPALRTLLKAGADPSVTSRVVRLPAQEAVDRAANQRRDEVLSRFREEAGSPVSWRPTPEQVQEAVKAAQEVQRSMAAVAAEPAEEREQVAGEEVVGFSGLVGSQGGLTALLHAVREGYSDAAHLLLEGGADINQPSAGEGTSPILMATINGHFDLALELLDKGADPNLANDAGALPLFAAINTHWAPRSRYPQQLAFMNEEATYMDVMRRLLEGGADPNARLTKHLWFMSYTFDLLSVDTRGATAFWRAAYATDVEAMRLLVEFGADPNIPTTKGPERRRRGPAGPDPSGLEPIPTGGPAVWPIHAASGVGYGEGFAGNAHRHVPDGWVPAVRYLVEEMGADVNARDHNGYSPVHHAAARGDNELILYLVEKGADVTGVSRRGQTTVDMANGPVQRISPFPETIALLESMGAKNNNRCLSC